MVRRRPEAESWVWQWQVWMMGRGLARSNDPFSISLVTTDPQFRHNDDSDLGKWSDGSSSPCRSNHRTLYGPTPRLTGMVSIQSLRTLPGQHTMSLANNAPVYTKTSILDHPAVMTLKDRVWSCSSSYHGIRSIADAALADKYGVQGSFLSPEDAIAGQTWEDDRFSRILASSHHKSPAPTDHRRSPTAGIQRVGRDGDDFASSRLKAASTTVMPDQIDVLLHGLGA
ncbi:uncharacterized protein N7459_005417 [Penicillium hispanicum]|uniref:uncharacterized protein n=1 Tax=Penicillium hispanicum TaxID=1080232 RepID=UPI0025407D47|nr:uncharacterized protein N7459_005417 [Penicillium hispanicum]KAJ5585617.1 hypothetical protein N7459_005417 [Penicillium hispanicum]